MSEDNFMFVCIDHRTDVGPNLGFGFGDKDVDNQSIEVFFAFKRT